MSSSPPHHPTPIIINVYWRFKRDTSVMKYLIMLSVLLFSIDSFAQPCLVKWACLCFLRCFCSVTPLTLN